MFDLVVAEKPVLNRASPKGEKAMFVAAKCGYTQVVDAFLEIKVLDMINVYPGGNTLVHVVAAEHAGIVTKFLEAGWMPVTLEKDEETPLHDAVNRIDVIITATSSRHSRVSRITSSKCFTVPD